MNMKVTPMHPGKDVPAYFRFHRYFNVNELLFARTFSRQMATPSFSIFRLETVNYGRYIVLYDK